MNNQPIISVIVVTFNQEDTIGRTLDSILRQRCRVGFEIVVGEDCSTDGTRRVCEAYAEKYPDMVRLMPKAPNKGVVDNYFDCLMTARGQYLADCAGDDWWTDNTKLQREYEVMLAHPEVTLVHTGWQRFNTNTRLTSPNTFVPFPQPVTDGHTMLEAIIAQEASPVVHLCTALYRADTIRRAYREYPEFFHGRQLGCEDLQIVFFCALHGSIAYLPQTTLSYSVGSCSVSNAQWGNDGERRQFRFVQRTAQLSHRLMTRFGVTRTALSDRFFADKLFALLMHAFRCHDRSLFAEALQYRCQWMVKPSFRHCLLSFIMGHERLWMPCLTFRNLAVRLKALLKH